MKLLELDFSTMREIPARQNDHDKPKLTVTAKGLITLNCALRRRLGERRTFRALISPDGRFIALCLQGEPNIRFSPQSGHTYHMQLAHLLEDAGLGLPAAYDVEWSGEHEAWVGCCRELAPPPALASLARTRQGTRRRKGGKGA